jgi:multiple sugar transport system substrate-binding protein
MLKNINNRCITILFASFILFPFFLSGCGKGDGISPAPIQGKKFVFTRKPVASITFLSTQLNPVEETGKMRNSILKDFPGVVDFRPNDNSFIFSQMNSLLKGDPSHSIIIGALHGDLETLYEEGALEPMEEAYRGMGKRDFVQSLLELSKLDGKNSYYVPWMQASFVMTANKKALPYLPKGASPETLTYAQLLQWSKNVFEKTGKRTLGFPAGETGLMHRFFQGYLYPSFTASTLLKFRGEEAAAMWEYFKQVWRYTNPGSLSYVSMSDPLLMGEVWIAWDHSARLTKVFNEKPDDFIAFPAPIGPKGRGFMAVISGLAVPKSARNGEDASILIDYLTRPEIQARTLRETGFFPVVSGSVDGVPKGLSELSGAIERQAASRDSIATLLPIGLGERGGDYNRIFMLTFSEIVLEGKPTRTALDENAEELQAIVDQMNVKCWLPDVSASRPCKIE